MALVPRASASGGPGREEHCKTLAGKSTLCFVSAIFLTPAVSVLNTDLRQAEQRVIKKETSSTNRRAVPKSVPINYM